jgi:hypothetical protein
MLKTKLEGWEWFRTLWNETRTWMGYLTALSVLKLYCSILQCKRSAGMLLEFGGRSKRSEKN